MFKFAKCLSLPEGISYRAASESETRIGDQDSRIGDWESETKKTESVTGFSESETKNTESVTENRRPESETRIGDQVDLEILEYSNCTKPTQIGDQGRWFVVANSDGWSLILSWFRNIRV